MSYRKVSDGVRVIEHTGESLVVPGNQADSRGDRSILSKAPIRYELPMSYVACPKCGNQDIHSICNCYPTNYACSRCSWQHITHNHQPRETPEYKGDVSNNSLLSKALRK